MRQLTDRISDRMAERLAGLVGVSPEAPHFKHTLVELTKAASAGADPSSPLVRAACEDRALRAIKKAADVAQRSTIYYLQVGQYIKIGTAIDLNGRLSAYPPDSVVLATEPGSYELESQRHRQFADALAARREWFRPTPKLLAHIAQLSADAA